MRLSKFITIIALSIVFLVLVPTKTVAQGGIDGGYLHARYKTKYIESGDVYQKRSMNGFFVGASDDIRFFSGFGIHTGLYYNFLKDQSVDDFTVLKMTGVTENHSFSIPLHLKMSFTIIPKMNLFIYLGPSLHFNFISDVNYNISSHGSSARGCIRYNFLSGKVHADGLDNELEAMAGKYLPSTRLNWFDATMGAGFGLAFCDLFELRLGYDWGLVNRFKNGYSSDLFCNVNQLQLSVGFRF